jgi:hypothetical protein
MNTLKEMLIALARCHVKFVVCGGVAVVLYGIERMTLDLDIVVQMNDENLRRLLDCLKSLGLQPRAPIPAQTLLDGELRRKMREEKGALAFSFIDLKNPYRQIDILISEEPSFEYLSNDAAKIAIDNVIVLAASKSKLIEMKQAVQPIRQKDKDDIQNLRRSLNGDAETNQ